MSDLFPDATVADVCCLEKIAELEREIRVRQGVYPRWVAQDKIDQATADKRILVLQAILKDYRDPRPPKVEALLEEWHEEMRYEVHGVEKWRDLVTRTIKILGLPER